MLQLSEQAWRALLSNGRHPEPGLVQNAYPEIEGDLLWQALQKVSEARHQNNPQARARFYLEHEDGPNGRFFSEVFHPVTFLPRPEEAGFGPYQERLTKELKGQRFGLVVNNLHLFDFALWQKTLPFFSRIYEATGAPQGGVSFDLFLGNYRRTPFGIHKDDQDVYTFIVKGKKRFYLWPLERFAERPEVSGIARDELEWSGAQIPVSSEKEYRALLEEAIVLEGGPGDVLYWPASYWHCAENEEGAFAVTIGPGLTYRGSFTEGLCTAPSSWKEAPSVLVKEGGLVSSPSFLRGRRALSRPGFAAEVQKDAAKRLLSRKTGYFYRDVPAAAPTEALSEEAILQGGGFSSVLWLPLSATDWVISANGHSMALSAPAFVLRKLKGMLTLLNSGAAVGVSQLLEGFTGRSKSSRGAALELLSRLASWRAARVLSVQQKERSVHTEALL